MAEDRVLLEAVGELAVRAELRVPVRELLLGRQLAEHEKVRGLLVAEASLLAIGVHKILDVDAAVEELAGNGLALAFAHYVAVDVADSRQPDEHACAVVVSEPAFDAVLAIERRVDSVCLAYLVRVRLQPFLVDHGPISP